MTQTPKGQVTIGDIITKYAKPDPSIVQQLPKGNVKLDFVGHADITRILIEIDPLWSWEPVAFDDNGLPAIKVENGMAHMAGWLTVLGVRRLGIASVAHNKPDLYKELASDFLRNAAMRFGIALNLWTKSEWDDIPTNTTVTRPTTTTSNPLAKKPTITTVKPDDKMPGKITPQQKNQFLSACEARGINPASVAQSAGINLDADWTEADLAKLRIAYKEMSNA